MSWMDSDIIVGLQATLAETVENVAEWDEAAASSRSQAATYERQAADGRRQIGHLRTLVAIASGHAPVPAPGDVRTIEDRIGLAFGPLRIGGENDGSPEYLTALAKSMRSLYAVAASVAHRAEETARELIEQEAAASRPAEPGEES